mmetsp:Transcript_117808/g.340548  ORF Transcript_117808/g.340548 Transcript_117808/m.340548 type:complete len:382 (+) Transcript_117808:34-1179(+)
MFAHGREAGDTSPLKNVRRASWFDMMLAAQMQPPPAAPRLLPSSDPIEVEPFSLPPALEGVEAGLEATREVRIFHRGGPTPQMGAGRVVQVCPPAPRPLPFADPFDVLDITGFELPPAADVETGRMGPAAFGRHGLSFDVPARSVVSWAAPAFTKDQQPIWLIVDGGMPAEFEPEQPPVPRAPRLRPQARPVFADDLPLLCLPDGICDEMECMGDVPAISSTVFGHWTKDGESISHDFDVQRSLQDSAHQSVPRAPRLEPMAEPAFADEMPLLSLPDGLGEEVECMDDEPLTSTAALGLGTEEASDCDHDDMSFCLRPELGDLSLEGLCMSPLNMCQEVEQLVLCSPGAGLDSKCERTRARFSFGWAPGHWQARRDKLAAR